MNPTRHDHESGFTLVEVLITSAVLIPLLFAALTANTFVQRQVSLDLTTKDKSKLNSVRVEDLPKSTYTPPALPAIDPKGLGASTPKGLGARCLEQHSGFAKDV